MADAAARGPPVLARTRGKPGEEFHLDEATDDLNPCSGETDLNHCSGETKMRKSLASLLVAACWAALSCSPAFAGQPTTTAAATFNNGFLLTPNTGKWTTILTTTIKNPTADDDLFIDVSQVDALVTANLTTSAIPGLFSVGEVVLLLRVLVNGIPAAPGAIDFDNQVTELVSALQKFLALNCTQTTVQNVVVTTSCVCNSTTVTPASISCAAPPAAIPAGYTRTCTSASSSDPDVVTTCKLTTDGDQAIETVLESSIGHSYDFFAKGVGGMGDTHIVQVQEQLFQLATAGTAATEAFIGPSTLKIQAVNLKN